MDREDSRQQAGQDPDELKLFINSVAGIQTIKRNIGRKRTFFTDISR